MLQTDVIYVFQIWMFLLFVFLLIHIEGYNRCVIIQDKMSIDVPFSKCIVINEQIIIEYDLATLYIYCMMVMGIWKFIPPIKIIFDFSVGIDLSHTFCNLQLTFYYVKQYMTIQNKSIFY